jgi:hypothetical protein
MYSAMILIFVRGQSKIKANDIYVIRGEGEVDV